MKPELSSFDYLHDADLHYVLVAFSKGGCDVTIAATFHSDCGSPSVSSKAIEVTASDVTLLTSRVNGAVAGQETIDRCERRVSDDTWSLLAESLNLGIRRPQAELWLVTHSGSAWELLYETIELRIG